MTKKLAFYYYLLPPLIYCICFLLYLNEDIATYSLIAHNIIFFLIMLSININRLSNFVLPRNVFPLLVLGFYSIITSIVCKGAEYDIVYGQYHLIVTIKSILIMLSIFTQLMFFQSKELQDPYDYTKLFAKAYSITGICLAITVLVLLGIRENDLHEVRLPLGVFLHPTYITKSLIFSIICSFFMLQTSKPKQLDGAIAGLSTIICLTCCFALLSKGMLVSLLMCSIITLLATPPPLYLLLTALTFIMATLPIFTGKLLNYILSYINSGAIFSFTGRSEVWQIILGHILKHPIIGNGAAAAAVGWFYFPVIPHAHNELLNILFQYGIIGSILFLVILYNYLAVIFSTLLYKKHLSLFLLFFNVFVVYFITSPVNTTKLFIAFPVEFYLLALFVGHNLKSFNLSYRAT